MNMSFYEQEAQKKLFWGGPREIALAQNIFAAIPIKINTLIDVGCGDGYLIYYLNKKKYCNQFFAVDISQTRCNRIKKNLPFVKIYKVTAINLPFADNSFDLVICSEVLEHIINFKKAISELIRIARREIIITVPNDLPLVKITCPKCKATHYLDGHIHRFAKSDITELFHNKHIRIDNIKKFHTIYSYNRLTLLFPFFIRNYFDQILIRFEWLFGFLKPTYLLVRIKKTK